MLAVNCDSVVLRPRKSRINASAAEGQLARVSANFVPSAEESREVEVLDDVDTGAAPDGRHFQ